MSTLEYVRSWAQHTQDDSGRKHVQVPRGALDKINGPTISVAVHEHRRYVPLKVGNTILSH